MEAYIREKRDAIEQDRREGNELTDAQSHTTAVQQKYATLGEELQESRNSRCSYSRASTKVVDFSSIRTGSAIAVEDFVSQVSRSEAKSIRSRTAMDTHSLAFSEVDEYETIQKFNLMQHHEEEINKMTGAKLM